MVEAAPSVQNRVFDNAEGLARTVAEWVCELALSSNHDFTVYLSGGSTPRRLYEALAEPPIASRFPWGRAHRFWGDERFVPHDAPDSNYRMVHDALLSRAAVPKRNIHPISTQRVSPEQAAAAYEAMLKRFYGSDVIDPGRPVFDLTPLGIGEDGHTASLFPHHPALDERRHWAAAVIAPESGARVTLTYPPLNSSCDLAFLATGKQKREIVARARAGDPIIPAARIRPAGRLHWFTDRAATPQGALPANASRIE